MDYYALCESHHRDLWGMEKKFPVTATYNYGEIIFMNIILNCTYIKNNYKLKSEYL